MSRAYALKTLGYFYWTWENLRDSRLLAERRLAVFSKTLGIVTHDRILTGLPRERHP